MKLQFSEADMYTSNQTENEFTIKTKKIIIERTALFPLYLR